jgi:hypothetical protein
MDVSRCWINWIDAGPECRSRLPGGLRFSEIKVDASDEP